MKHAHLMTDADRQELSAIEAMAQTARKDKARLLNRLRQRALRERLALLEGVL